jgi:anti-sigma regulatory factor (Ser/Thr protein kinase)
MEKKRLDELSLHMRIPADKVYLGNAVLTLEGICEHFDIGDVSRDRMRSALQDALMKIIEISYVDSQGLFDLKFSVFKDKLQITVEDFMVIDGDAVSGSISRISESDLRRHLSSVEALADDLRVFSETGRNSCYSMQFNL